MVQAGRELLPQADAIVPIPLHRLRYWRRKYNQARLLADVVARETGRPVAPGWLERRKATASQVGLTRNERALNVAGAFRVPQASRAAVAGKRILLIDDTITTGATANAAASALLRAGAASVDVLSFARVVAEGA
jgi:ComF family protein